MKNRRTKKGFTLAELLIVVAIIAVMVAISIPIFSTQLEKSREATDLANARAAYAELMANALSDDTYSGAKSFPLKQKKTGWESSELTVAGIHWTGSDIPGHWEGTPGEGGTCEVSYTPDSGAKFKWDGGSGLGSSGSQSTATSVLDSAYDYFAKLSAAMNGTGSYCLNSTCTSNGTIKTIAGNIADQKFLDDIASWAVIRDTSTSANNNNNSILLSTFDISGMNIGSEVPALYRLKDGTYQVGTVQVNETRNKKDNGNTTYNIMTIDRNGNYAYTYDESGKGTANKTYQYNNLLKDSTSYSTLEEAQTAYKQLAQEFLSNNPGLTEGK